MEGQHLANISWALAQSNEPETAIHDSVSSASRWFTALAAEIRQRSIQQMEPKHLANIVWAMSRLGLREQTVLQHLGDELSLPGALAPFAGRDLAMLSRSFASLEVLHEQLFRSVAGEAKRSGLRSFSLQDLQ
ncbi:unnamed protein product, partial [Durusdinium trenchii]